MKKYVTLAVTCAMLTGAGQMLAETVSQKEASRVASLFSNASAGQVMGKPELAWNAKPLTTAKLFTPFYVYNLRNGGFVIVAADNKAFPILAYSRNGVFDHERLSDTQREWLRRYAQDIEMIRYDSRVPDEAIAAWGDLSTYINDLLEREPKQSGLHLFSAGQAVERLEDVEVGEDSYLTESELYTPQQWQEMIDGEMRQRGRVIIGMEDAKGNLLPVEVYNGGEGYYLLATENGSPDGTEPWIVRLNATEYLSGTMIADIGNPREIEIPEAEEEPFVEQDAFLAEVASA
ncbi:MAG: Spi family protease inhibitor, partial [Muribaculaceae bacterium]|nr:Spi family protease inhibitor [Muribaculaceae bacterium]